MRFDGTLYRGLNGTLDHGSSLILAGPSNCGKTTFAVNLIRYRKILFNENILKIIIITPHEQSIFDNLKETEENDNVEIFNELPTYDEIENMADRHMNHGLILLLDDIMEEMDSKLQLSRIFTKLCHHKRLTCILCVQNLFFQSNQYRNMSLNASYLSLFNNPRDLRQISILGSRMYPGNAGLFVNAFQRATSQPYSYLFIDYRQKSKNFMRLRTHILPTDVEPMTIFVPNEKFLIAAK